MTNLQSYSHISAIKTASGYTSARIKTQGKFTVRYGKIAVRMKIPHGQSMVLNLAVGGAWPGDPDSTTQFPQVLVVDWVRVWKK